jgi:MerR family transcriptional regulator, light-induced transcriptional regulator
MPLNSMNERVVLAENIRRLKPVVAESVTTEFFKRHPDWVTRYGERGRKLGIEDASFHLDFLAGALEAGSIIPFEEYVRWTTRMLGARKIATHFVAENLVQIESEVASHLTAAEAEYIAPFVRAGQLACSEPAGVVPSTDGRSAFAPARSLFLQAILKNQRKAAVTIVLEALRGGEEPTDIYVEILQESLYQVGKMWEMNQISVAEEHMATAISQYVMAQLYPLLPPATQSRGRMLITGVAGELHQIGANMVADVLDAEGFDVRFLGTNMPHSGIVQAIDEHDAAILGISATMLFSIPHVVKLIKEVREKLGERSPRVVLGGAAFRSAPSLTTELGAVGFASDIRAAVRMLV